MNYIDEYKDPQLIRVLAKQIEKHSTIPLNIMEVCGGHTHTIMRYAIKDLLPKHIRFIHGPGCPVCVISKKVVDDAISLAEAGFVVASLSDLIRIKGSSQSLAHARSNGHRIEALYSPLDLIDLALKNPHEQFVFVAIGFETTTPMTAVLLEKTIQMGLKNVFFYISHVRIIEPMEAILSRPNTINAFLGPSHVSVIIGSKPYEKIVQNFKRPVVITGFEPSDVLEGVLMCVKQAQQGECFVQNQYTRAVSEEGNQKAQELMSKFFMPLACEFRGLGEIDNSGLDLKDEYAHINAKIVFKDSLSTKHTNENLSCLCPQILSGLSQPTDCTLFRKACNPQNPIGSCMVSHEGACNAYYRYA